MNNFIRPNGYSPYYIGNYGQQQSQTPSQMFQTQQGMYQQPQMQMPMAQQQVPQQPMQANVVNENNLPIQEIKFCTSAEAIGYMLFPNTKSLLIDKANSLAYLKWADNQGNSSMKVFNYSEQGANTETEKPQEKVDMDNFATKEQIKDFISSSDLEPIKSSISKLQKDIEQMTKLMKLVGGENGK